MIEVAYRSHRVRMMLLNTLSLSIGVWYLGVLAAGSVLAQADPVEKEDDKNHPVTVDFGSIVSPCPVDELPALSVALTPTADATALLVRVDTTGLFSLATPGHPKTTSQPTTQPSVESRFRKVVKGVAHRMELPLVCLPDRQEGQLVLHVEARNARDEIINELEVALNGYAVQGRLYYGLQSPVALMQAHILDLEQAGLISPEESLRRRQELTTRRESARQPASPYHDANRDAGRQPGSRKDQLSETGSTERKDP
ncbi:MAG: hypothetical protein GY778_26990 [bacterium]|nr:hypothetical protein [bacterium]